MSCNGCRVLRKGCSDTCILRPCLQWIETAEAQGHATVFLAKFFGRAGLMSFISAVPETQRPALFQSLLYEACGRTVNPVHGAVGLLWTGNWNVCQAAVETVLKEGTLRPASSLPKIANTYQCSGGIPLRSLKPDEAMLSLSSPPPLNSSKLKRHSEDQHKHADDFARNSKRSRSSDLESNGGTIAECFIKGTSTWMSKPGFLNERSENVGNKVEMMKSEQCQQSSGQLLAPVPKKANMRMQESEIVTSVRSVGTPHQAIRASERIDLDLTLSFPAYPTGSGIVGDGRVSSPNISALSINSNSEGSVTSLDTLDLPASLNPPSSKQEHKLLDLLP